MTDLKTPLAQAAKTFSEVMEIVDDAAVIDDRLKQLFADAQDELGYRVNKRIMFHRELELRIEAAEAAAKLYKEQVAYLKQVHDKAKKLIQAEVESAPDVVFQGSLGKIWVQANTPGVDYSFGENYPVKADKLLYAGVDPAYLEDCQLFKVDGATVLADLQAGKELKWAKLKPGKGVRFSPLRKPKQIEGENRVSTNDD